MTDPVVVDRVARPYVALRARASMQTLGPELGPLAPRVFELLGQLRVAPDGPPFWRYLVIDMARELEVEVGVPIADAISVDEPFHSGVLPAGRYLTSIYTGHPNGLADVTRTLLEWAAAAGISWDMSEDAGCEHWGCRLEEYFWDPMTRPDMNQWQTRLAFRVAD